MIDPADKPEAALHAFELLRPDREQEKVRMSAHTELSAGRLTGDRAVSLWTEHWFWYLLEQRLRTAVQ